MSKNDIIIIIRLKNNESLVDPKLLLQSLEHLENALYESDRNDIERFDLLLNNTITNSPHLSSIIRDASLERLRRFKNKRLILTEARTGSIEIEGVVAAISLYVLEKTIGETLGEAFKETKTRELLKESFKRIIDQKAFFIADRIRSSFLSKKKKADIKYIPRDGYDLATKIILEISEDEKNNDRIGSLGEKLDE